MSKQLEEDLDLKRKAEDDHTERPGGTVTTISMSFLSKRPIDSFKE